MRRWQIVVVAGALFACSRTSDKREPDRANVDPPRAAPMADWNCAAEFSGSAGLVIRNHGMLEVHLKTSSTPVATRVSARDLRSASVTDDGLFWVDPKGVHRIGLDGSGERLLWSTDDAFVVAAHHERVVVSDGDGDLYLLSEDGGRRQVASKLHHDSELLLVHGDHAYVLTSLLREMNGDGPPSVIWSVDLDDDAPPKELVRTHQITGLCAGPQGEIRWLELDAAVQPRSRAPVEREARVMKLGTDKPLLAMRVFLATDLMTDDAGNLYFRAETGGAVTDPALKKDVLLQVTSDGSTKMRATIPTHSVVLGISGRHLLVDAHPDRLGSIPLN